MNEPGFKKFLPGIAWFFVILILICIPGEEIPQPEGWWNWINLIHPDKVVHMGIFAVLTFLFQYPYARTSLPRKTKWHYFLTIAFIAAIWGLSTELIQKFFVPTRHFDFIDVIADTLGVLIALLFSRLFLLKTGEKQAV